MAAILTPVEQAPVRQRTGMEWFYRLLDVEYGINIAVRDATRATTWQSALFSFIVSTLLLLAFALVWIRYDLVSTATVFLPVRENIITVLPAGDSWATARWVIGVALGVASTFLTSLIQWAYSRLAAQHEAALWGFAAACIFDIATDYKDVSKDFPTYFASLIAAATEAHWGWWLGGAAACLVASFIWSGGRALYLLFMVACLACFFGNARDVLWWMVVFCGTIFASFAAQSLVLIHVAKSLTLLAVVQRLRGHSS